MKKNMPSVSRLPVSVFDVECQVWCNVFLVPLVIAVMCLGITDSDFDGG